MLYDTNRCMRDSQSEATVVVSWERPERSSEETLGVILTNVVGWGQELNLFH